MSDVRLTATNPEDSSVVRVACNSRGELLTVPPVIEQIDNDVTINGDFAVNPGVDGLVIEDNSSKHLTSRSLSNIAGGSQTTGALFSFETYTNFSVPIAGVASVFGTGGVSSSSYVCGFLANAGSVVNVSSSNVLCGYYSNYQIGTNQGSGETFNFYSNGNAPNFFKGEVIVGSRNKSWTLVEQGGLCHLVEYPNTYSIEDEAPLVEKDYPKLRDVFNELNLIEGVLEEVMARLKMVPPAGWQVWDGSNETA
jgi:hypothetical protein